MNIKEIIIKLFPFLYIKKNFSRLAGAAFSNYRERNIEPELLLLKYFLKEGKSFVDVGSNKGLFLFMASGVLPPGAIYAFEPNPQLYNKIRHVFRKINLFRIALSSRSGSAVLTVPFTGSHPDDSLGNILNAEIKNNAFNFQVDLKRLDDLEKEFGNTGVGLIKIDVEGHELDVIKGAEHVLRKHQPILIVEIEQRHHSEPVTRIVDKLMSSFQYSCFYFLPSANRLINFSDQPEIHQHKKDFGGINYVNNFIFIASVHQPENLVKKINSDIEQQEK
jgi:FkbM family methyltransferase